MNRTESQLIDAAVELLTRRLPPGWSVEQGAGQGAGAGEGDALFTFRNQAGGSSGSAIVEAKPDFAAADIERLLGGLTRRLREVAGDRTIVLVSEFLSPRTRELLAKENISYLDLTGNIRLVMRMPAIFVETSGAERRPRTATSKRTAGLRGAQVGRVVRFLAEVAPPYGVIDIETETGISRGYVSRVLDRLTDEALIRREPRGPVEEVDWPAMLRMRGQSVDLFTANTSRSFVAPNGARGVFESLQGSSLGRDLVVTGSFAAVRKAPVAAPALLTLYLRPERGGPGFEEIESALGLWRTEEGADVVLLRPSNDRVVEDTWTADGVEFVNLPQLVVDCLSGSGRMPAEGEALIDWMQQNETEWRWDSLAEYRKRDGQ